MSSALSKIEIKRAVRNYVTNYSTLSTLRGCARIYLPRQQTWNRCGHALCWSCARKRAEDLSADLRRRSESYSFVYLIRLSVQSTTPSAPLDAAWDRLDDLRRRLTLGRWLTGRVAAFRWFTEITRGPGGWHPHVNLIAVSRKEIDPSEIPVRWEALAASEGVFAPADAQYVERITCTPGRALRYATKGTLALHGDSRTAGVILLDAALHGDADAAADWAEIETASARRRWQGTGGEWRGHGA